MLRHPPDPAMEAIIVELTANLILNAEMAVIEEVVSGERTLRFSRLLAHMLKPNTGIPVVTTNYDRLIEIAAEAVGLGVDTLFVGQHVGHLDSKRSQFSLCRGLFNAERLSSSVCRSSRCSQTSRQSRLVFTQSRSRSLSTSTRTSTTHYYTRSEQVSRRI